MVIGAPVAALLPLPLLVLSRPSSPPLSRREQRTRVGTLAGWKVLEAVFGPPFRELQQTDWTLAQQRRESRADPGDAAKRRRLSEAREARDVAAAIIDSLEMEYSIGHHCTVGGAISVVVPPCRGGNGDEDGSCSRQG